MNRVRIAAGSAALAAAPLTALAHHEANSAMTGGALFFTGVGLACVLWVFLRRVWG